VWYSIGEVDKNLNGKFIFVVNFTTKTEGDESESPLESFALSNFPAYTPIAKKRNTKQMFAVQRQNGV